MASNNEKKNVDLCQHQNSKNQKY